MNAALLLSPTALDAFLTRWRDAAGSERANYQLFVGALCDVLDLPAPEPATGQPEQDGYVFEGGALPARRWLGVGRVH